MRNPSAAQISKLHQSEQLKAEELNKDADVLSLETSGLAGTQPAYSKISTPDRHIAAGLLAACMAPFPHAAKHKERRESSSISKESAATNTGGGCSATAATKEANAGSGSAATAAATVVSSQAANVPQAPVGAPSSTMQLHMPVIGAGMQFHMTPHGALPVQVSVFYDRAFRGGRRGWVSTHDSHEEFQRV